MTVALTLLTIALVASLVVALGPSAWGPGIHIQLAQELLERRDELPDESRRLLEEHADSFQYGCIAADIINLKKYGGLDNHCHNWNIKERLEALIEHDAERAFLAGYLCHLAADLIAHNHFVPYHVLYDLPPALLGHTYWEARADDVVREETWWIVDGLRTHRELHDNDDLIHQAVPKKAFSMLSNKLIFNHVLLARSKKKWREVMTRMRTRRPARPLQARHLQTGLGLCLENMFLTFTDDGLAQLREGDPNGHAALKESRVVRRRLVDEHGSRKRASHAACEAAEDLFGLRRP